MDGMCDVHTLDEELVAAITEALEEMKPRDVISFLAAAAYCVKKIREEEEELP